MLVDNPVIHLPSAPVNRPWVGDRPGGSAVAVITESLRPLHDAERAAPGRGVEKDELRQRGDRPQRNDAEMAARIRIGIARERAFQAQNSFAGTGSGDPDNPSARGDYISAAEIRQRRERLEARMARDPGMLTLLSVDVRA